jgi:hypothetical protein
MNHPWQQPIRPLEVTPNSQPGHWYMVLFIRPISPWGPADNYGGWEVISEGGHVYRDENSMLRIAD